MNGPLGRTLLRSDRPTNAKQDEIVRRSRNETDAPPKTKAFNRKVRKEKPQSAQRKTRT
jgi:hypothetical protein